MEVARHMQPFGPAPVADLDRQAKENIKGTN